MKGNRQLDELLISYIAEELHAEDKALAEHYISTNEDVRKQYEQLRNTWKLLSVNRQLDKIEVDREWNRFEQSVSGKEQKLTVIKISDVPENEIITEEKPRSVSLRKTLVSIAVAASVLAFVIFGWMYTARQKTQQRMAGTIQPAIDSIRSVLRHEINASAKPRKLYLKDGSEIVLYGQSEISYHEPFILNKRDISLKGTADFKVAKDKTKPFTVFSHNLATTVLGTHFTVTDIEHAKNTTVKLMEGKVVVKPAAPDQRGNTHEYYLMPGQKLIYNNRNNAVTVLDFNRKNPGLQQNGTAQVYNDLPELPGSKKGSWFMFNNQSLDQVFDQLSLLYHVDIVYSKTEISNVYFIGRFNKSDSLEAVINQISAVNNLKVTRQNNKLIIAK